MQYEFLFILLNPVISCAVNLRKSVSGTCTLDPKFFSDVPLATAHMTDLVTHMCWSEQISPLTHSLQATWQPFNLSHCIEMHNTHLLGCAGQLKSDIFHTFGSDFDSAQSATDCQQIMAAIARITYVTLHSLQHQLKNENCSNEWYISWHKYNLQVDTTIDRNPILYFYCVENVEILVVWNAIREFVTEKLIQLWWNPAAYAWSHFCFLSSCDDVHGLADFNTESIMCCLRQCVIWQFCCIIIKI